MPLMVVAEMSIIQWRRRRSLLLAPVVVFDQVERLIVGHAPVFWSLEDGARELGRATYHSSACLA